jgi:transposase InsO family protein
MPNQIIADLGSPFTSIKFKYQRQDYGINIDYTLVSHVWANEQVEWTNDLLLQVFKPRLYEQFKNMMENRCKSYPK